MNRKTLRHSLQKGTQALGVELRVLPQVLKQLLEAGVSHPLSGGPGLGGALVELLKKGAQGQGQERRKPRVWSIMSRMAWA